MLLQSLNSRARFGKLPQGFAIVDDDMRHPSNCTRYRDNLMMIGQQPHSETLTDTIAIKESPNAPGTP